VETGSLGYGCGLKSFVVGGRVVTLEVFKNCSFKGAALESRRAPKDERPRLKFDSDGACTRFRFEFDGRTFALKEREVSHHDVEDVMNYEPTINISDD
jgi:hypothetical protein